ncbi:MAG TPA: hypothetical protein P5228_07315 [Bacteroidales bacterium]|nr:hypothetical protein [Bacteroidales bacterium]HRZ48707.1 hypothetical protein [Bacteroidales bacterium]
MKKFWFILAGVIVVVGSVFLDQFGLNTKEGFGLVQIAGLVVGAVLILVGLIVKGKKKAQ